MASTRDQILQVLRTRPRRTINELALEVGINPISVRHHIANLEADNLVTAEEERHGVGRPRQVFSLTEAGTEMFPTRYVRLTVRLLEQLKESMPASMVGELFAQIAQDMAKDIASDSQVQNMTIEERLELVKMVLRKEGFEVEWEQQGSEYHIQEISCPYYHVGQNHPEVCAVDQIFISTILSTPVEKVKCILNGDAHCTYVIPDPDHAEK